MVIKVKFIRLVLKTKVMFPLDELFEDAELQRLTREYPVRETLGRHHYFWGSELVTEAHSQGFFLNSPAQNAIAERTFLGFLLRAAAQYDKWLGFKTAIDPRYVPYLITALSAGIDDVAVRAIKNARDTGMARLVVSEHMYLLPTEKYIKFVQERARR